MSAVSAESRQVFDEGTWKALLKNLGTGACLAGRFLNEKALQSFFDNGFLIWELAVLDLLFEEAVEDRLSQRRSSRCFLPTVEASHGPEVILSRRLPQKALFR
jgi:hypothetical protein